ncbi:MAG TPA: hypothetical protein DIT32_02900 [Peptococcaceae bacterium]|nr:hypothetical protein [Peptococcaceae bacterium]
MRINGKTLKGNDPKGFPVVLYSTKTGALRATRGAFLWIDNRSKPLYVIVDDKLNERGEQTMKWNRMDADVFVDAKKMPQCALCSQRIADTFYAPKDFNELKSLLREKESALGLKLEAMGQAEAFIVCENCKEKVDEELKSSNVHITFDE